MSTVIQLRPEGSFRDDVAARLRQGIVVRNLKKTQIAEFIGMNQASFSKRVNARLPINVDEADTICAAIGISRNWLFTGSGEMLDPEWVRPKGFEPLTFCDMQDADADGQVIDVDFGQLDHHAGRQNKAE